MATTDNTFGSVPNLMNKSKHSDFAEQIASDTGPNSVGKLVNRKENSVTTRVNSLSGGVGPTAVEMQRRLIAKTKTDKTNPIAVNNAYDSVGSNGIFQASPAVVKFAGFETNKTHTLKVRLINTSPAPQRLHILPPSTPFFKIRYNKKGMLPTGVAEEIYVQFTPPVDQYKYYYDSLRIHCEGDKILIPMHAYPVINSKADKILPSVVDMGVGCRLG